MKKTKNLKGFTLVEEVVSLFILSILILVASGMMISAMRVYSVNVKTQSAQNKGQYVYDLLDEKLTYASGIQYQKIGENETFNPPNETDFTNGEEKNVFDETNEVCQSITVKKDGITNSINNNSKTIEFDPYDVEVSLQLETTTAASASADNSMNDEALFNLVSNSEVTDSAGYLTPQGEVSFLGSLEIMNQSAEVRTIATAGVDCTFTESDFRSDNNLFGWDFAYYIQINSNLSSKIDKIETNILSVENKYKPEVKIYNENNINGSEFNPEINGLGYKENNIKSFSYKNDGFILVFWRCKPEYVSFYDKDGNLLDANGNVATEKTKTLKIDNSDADKDITLWAGETQTFQLSSTLENVNGIYIEKNENYPISDSTKSENGNFTLTLTALKPASGQPTDFELKVYDRYYFKDPNNLSITDNKGVPITIRVHIKVPQINTTSITMYKNESTDINIGDIPFNYMSCSSDTATIVKAEKNNEKITLTSFDSETTEPVKITLTYNCNGVTYNFTINVTVEEEPSEEDSEDSSDEQPPSSSDEDEASSENSTNSTGTPMSSYRMKLTVTVKDKKGKEMYKRSGSISVINYENSDMKDKRFPKNFPTDTTNKDLNNISDSGFVLKIYYID